MTFLDWRGDVDTASPGNLVANLLFMPIFAGLRSVPLAVVDIVIVWATLVWCVVAVAQVPYIVWASLATVLQLPITATNR